MIGAVQPTPAGSAPGAPALTVYIDFKSPYAYLAIEPTRQLARALDVKLDWLPFVLDIPSYLGSAQLDKRGQVARQSRTTEQWSGVKYAYYDCRRYANLRGLTIRGTVKIWDTNLAAIGMLWARQQGDEILQRYIDGVYLPFWKRALDVESIDVVEDVLAQAGADVEGFRRFVPGQGAQLNGHLQDSAFNQGIFGVPTYTLGEELYFGREHLPRIRWQLQGRRGAAPDIAYELFADDIVEPAQSRSLEVGIALDEAESYLAIPAILAMARDLDLAVNWYTLPARKRRSAPAVDDTSRSARHRRWRRENRQRDVRRYLQEMPEQDVASATRRLLQNSEIHLGTGEPAAAWAGAGYVSSPVFRVGEEVFVGRQHLPLIRARFTAAANAC